MKGHCLFDTPLGTCAIAWTKRGIRALAMPEHSPAATVRRIAEATGTDYAAPPREVAQVVARVARHLAGRPDHFSDVRVDLSDVPAFHREVYAATRAVMPGQVTTYGDIARRLGRPGASRAVGQALAHNPVALIVPCHRVVSRSGKLAGFSAPGGVATKCRLLDIEVPTLLAAGPQPAATA